MFSSYCFSCQHWNHQETTINWWRKKKLVRDALNELAEKLAAGALEDVLDWIKNVGCAVGPVACEIAFPEFAWACAIGFGILCGL